MLPELGFFCLILAFVLASLQWGLPLYGIFLFFKRKKHSENTRSSGSVEYSSIVKHLENTKCSEKRDFSQRTKSSEKGDYLGIEQSNLYEAFLKVTRPLALGQSFFIVLSFLILSYSFIANDFTIAYIAQHSNTSLPWIYKISAVWGGHEGSLLLSAIFLAFWTTAVSLSSRKLPLPLAARILSILGFISASFLLFIITVSNPFLRLLPNYPLDGIDLNPLLQDLGLIIHPPILYLGYVGFTVPFAFAIAVLWLSELQTAWVNWIRPFILLSWGFLTIGIALGSWWAYYELGWGGWWFWDPVENASFMPWLVATALVHSLIITRKKKQFSAWTLLLAIIVFALCLIGSFLVRSGIISTVHAFASDPKRGMLILEFVTVVIGISLAIFSVRARKISHFVPISLFSRESLLVFNSMILLVLALSILLGTIFPMFYEILTHRKISVGFPYFNSFFIPLMIPILCSIPLGPFTRWGENHPFSVLNQLKWSLLLSIFLAIVLPWAITKQTSLSVTLGLFLAFWVGLGTLQRLQHKITGKGKGLKDVSLGAWGMILGHLGIAVTTIGIVIVSNYSIELEMRVLPQVPITIADYQVTLKEVKIVEGSNYLSRQAHFTLEKNGRTLSDLFPEKRLFVVPGSMMTETAIDAGFFRDIYISLGEKLPDGGIAARIYYKPFIRWIWLGAFMIAAGAFVAACHRKEKK